MTFRPTSNILPSLLPHPSSVPQGSTSARLNVQEFNSTLTCFPDRLSSRVGSVGPCTVPKSRCFPYIEGAKECIAVVKGRGACGEVSVVSIIERT